MIFNFADGLLVFSLAGRLVFTGWQRKGHVCMFSPLGV